MLEKSETSENLEKFRKFSNEGHAAPILRGQRGAAVPQSRPRHGRRRGRRRVAAAAAAAAAAVAAAAAAAAAASAATEKSFNFRIGKVT